MCRKPISQHPGLGTGMRSVSCGDGHSCALDNLKRAWLWGTYKDGNGHIGIAQKRKQDPVLEKSAEPAMVLEGCIQIASGANHTVALAKSSTTDGNLLFYALAQRWCSCPGYMQVLFTRITMRAHVNAAQRGSCDFSEARSM